MPQVAHALWPGRRAERQALWTLPPCRRLNGPPCAKVPPTQCNPPPGTPPQAHSSQRRLAEHGCGHLHAAREKRAGQLRLAAEPVRLSQVGEPAQAHSRKLQQKSASHSRSTSGTVALLPKPAHCRHTAETTMKRAPHVLVVWHRGLAAKQRGHQRLALHQRHCSRAGLVFVVRTQRGCGRGRKGLALISATAQHSARWAGRRVAAASRQNGGGQRPAFARAGGATPALVAPLVQSSSGRQQARSYRRCMQSVALQNSSHRAPTRPPVIHTRAPRPPGVRFMRSVTSPMAQMLGTCAPRAQRAQRARHSSHGSAKMLWRLRRRQRDGRPCNTSKGRTAHRMQTYIKKVSSIHGNGAALTLVWLYSSTFTARVLSSRATPASCAGPAGPALLSRRGRLGTGAAVATEAPRRALGRAPRVSLLAPLPRRAHNGCCPRRLCSSAGAAN